MRTNLKYFGLTVLALIAVYGAVYAKEEAALEDPAAEWAAVDNPFVVRNPLNATAHYGWIDSEDDVDAFQFELGVPATNFYVSVAVPACADAFVSFYPSIAVIGDGLQTVESTLVPFAILGAGLGVTENVDVPFELPDGASALVFNEAAGSDSLPFRDDVAVERAYFDADPFGYYINLPNTLDYLEPGTYTVAVWSPDGQTGPYVLRTGSTHPDFADYTDDDWEEMEDMYATINSGGWTGQDC